MLTFPWSVIGENFDVWKMSNAMSECPWKSGNGKFELDADIKTTELISLLDRVWKKSSFINIWNIAKTSIENCNLCRDQASIQKCFNGMDVVKICKRGPKMSEDFA